MESREAKSSTSTISTEDSFSKSETNYVKNEVRKNKLIVVTRCLSQACMGFYTDSISESIFIKCLDPKHNIDEAMGPDKPTATDADNNPTTKLGVLSNGIYNKVQKSLKN